MKRKTNLKKNWFRRESGHFFVEILLIFASVLIFRSAWTLMDQVWLLSNNTSLWTMLVIGVVVTVASINFLFRHEKFH